MFSFLPDPPGLDDVRALARRVDTARHHGVPNGCVLELDLRVPPPETSSLDPLTIITGGGRPLALREAVSALHPAAGARGRPSRAAPVRWRCGRRCPRCTGRLRIAASPA